MTYPETRHPFVQELKLAAPGGEANLTTPYVIRARVGPAPIYMYNFQDGCFKDTKMGMRGRPSLTSLMLPDNPIEIGQRPDAPYDLTDEQSEEWRAIVNTMPPDHFMRGNYSLLSQLCRHIVAARRVAQLVEQAAEQHRPGRNEFRSLLRLQSAESSMISRLLRSMRLTQQSIMRAETTKHPKRLTKAPWDPE